MLRLRLRAARTRHRGSCRVQHHLRPRGREYKQGARSRVQRRGPEREMQLRKFPYLPSWVSASASASVLATTATSDTSFALCKSAGNPTDLHAHYRRPFVGVSNGFAAHPNRKSRVVVVPNADSARRATGPRSGCLSRGGSRAAGPVSSPRTQSDRGFWLLAELPRMPTNTDLAPALGEWPLQGR